MTNSSRRKPVITTCNILLANAMTVENIYWLIDWKFDTIEKSPLSIWKTNQHALIYLKSKRFSCRPRYGMSEFGAHDVQKWNHGNHWRVFTVLSAMNFDFPREVSHWLYPRSVFCCCIYRLLVTGIDRDKTGFWIIISLFEAVFGSFFLNTCN